MGRVWLGSTAAVLLIESCGDGYHCIGPHDTSPCAEHFDVANFCGTTNCQVDGALYACDGSCVLPGGKVLAVPIADFATDLKSHDLRVTLTAGCNAPATPDITVSIDGIPAEKHALGSGDGEYYFRWTSFPSAPNALTIVLNSPSPMCVDALLNFVDEACDEANPPCPL